MILEAQYNSIVHPYVSKSEFLVNRFSTATFDLESLLIDFKEVLMKNKEEFNKYPQIISNYLYGKYINKFDSLIANKIIGNPERFIFQNSVIWNSFFQLLRTMQEFHLKYQDKLFHV